MSETGLWKHILLMADGRYMTGYSDYVPKVFTSDAGYHYDLWSVDPLTHIAVYHWI